MYTLWIANKNYSSWSLKVCLLLKTWQTLFKRIFASSKMAKVATKNLAVYPTLIFKKTSK